MAGPWDLGGGLFEAKGVRQARGSRTQFNLQFQTTTNCSLKIGFTKHEMGKLDPDVRAAWCMFGNGASRAPHKENRGLAVNLLLNLCGFQGLQKNGPGSEDITLTWVPKSQPLARSDFSSPSGQLLPSEQSEAHILPRPPGLPTSTSSGHLLPSEAHRPPPPPS